MMFGTGQTLKFSLVRISDWFHDPTPLGEENALLSQLVDRLCNLTKVETFDVTFATSSNPF